MLTHPLGQIHLWCAKLVDWSTCVSLAPARRSQQYCSVDYLLVTSRHIPTIENRFRDTARLKLEAKDEDVSVFLEAWVPQRALWSHLVKADSYLLERSFSSILEKSNGMYVVGNKYFEG